MPNVNDNDNLIRVKLFDAYLVLRDYKGRPTMMATAYRFTQSTRALAPEERPYQHGTLQLVFQKTEDGKMEVEKTMGIFLDNLPVYAVQLSQQHEWKLLSLSRGTLASLCDQPSILIELLDEENRPLARALDAEPDQLLKFMLGSSELDSYYPPRINFITPKSLFITPGDPLLLEVKPQETPFTVVATKHPDVGTEYEIRADRHLLTVLIKDDGDYLVSAGKWANDVERYSYVPVLAQLYRIVSESSFVPFKLIDGDFSKLVTEEDYLKTLQGYITNLNNEEKSSKSGDVEHEQNG